MAREGRSRERDSKKRRKDARADSDDSTSSRERFKSRRKAQLKFLAKSQRGQVGGQGMGIDQSMFWDGFQWIPRGVGANSQEHNATRKNRRLYVANLPINLGLSEEMLGQQLFVHMRDKGFVSMEAPNPVLHVWFARDKGGSYGFVEFATLEDTEKALTLDGISVMGNAITIKRPSDYTLPILTPSILGGTLPSLIDVSSITSSDPKPTSRIVRMEKAMRATEDTESDEYLDVIQDMMEAVDKFKTVVNKVMIARTDILDPVTSRVVLSGGDVLLEFPDIDKAEKCFKATKGRKYDGRPVNLVCVDEQQWRNLLLPILFEMNADDEGLGF
jgi:splicing factor U2AF 65 kDa subunit